MKFRLCLICILLAGGALAQDGMDFYPLNIGNYWEFHDDSVGWDNDAITHRIDVEEAAIRCGKKQAGTADNDQAERPRDAARVAIVEQQRSGLPQLLPKGDRLGFAGAKLGQETPYAILAHRLALFDQAGSTRLRDVQRAGSIVAAFDDLMPDRGRDVHPPRQRAPPATTSGRRGRTGSEGCYR